MQDFGAATMMILSRDVKPERQIYRLGAEVLRILLDSPESIVDYEDAYEIMRQEHHTSENVFAFVLDWLFLLGAVDCNDGEIAKCF
jgi:hypothetical protein